MIGVEERPRDSGLNGRTVPVERRKEVRIAKESCDVDAVNDVRAITYKIAVGKDEVEDAFSLVWNNYVEAGLHKDDHTGVRFTKYHLLPDTRIFIANYHQELADHRPDLFKGGGKVVGTVSLVLDGPLGLPMDEFCSEHLDKLRSEGRKLAEVVAFALNPEYSQYKVFLHMFKLLFQFAELKGVTDLCCSVTERHIRFYQNVCLFEPMGGLVPYSAAYKLKVQGHRLDMAEANVRAKNFYSGREFDADLHRFFFTESYNRSRGEGEPLSPDLLKYFLTEKTHYIDSMPENEISLIRSEYEKANIRFPF